ncbi:MAG: ABC transporter ATP-binding protein [Acholeplasmataceae bacterium]
MIKINNFTKKYDHLIAVNNISVHVEKGLITGFVGKNGAGKTTTLRTMVNLLFPTEGSILISDLDSVKDAIKIKKVVSYMSGEPAFYHNLKAKDLFDFHNQFLNYNDPFELAKYFELDVSKPIETLSLGNKKKVSIILTLMKDADVYLLDEPTSGLDPLMQEKFFSFIKDLKSSGKTVFLSSHNLSEIEKHCDKVLVIKDGFIVDYLDLRETPKKYYVSYKVDNELIKKYYEGNINELIQELSQIHLEELEIKRVSLEEDLIDYYKAGDIR